LCGLGWERACCVESSVESSERLLEMSNLVACSLANGRSLGNWTKSSRYDIYVWRCMDTVTYVELTLKLLAAKPPVVPVMDCGEGVDHVLR